MRRSDSVRIRRFASSCLSIRSAVQSHPPHSFAIGHGAARRHGLGLTSSTRSALAKPFFTSKSCTRATSPGNTFTAKTGKPSTRASAAPPATSSVGSMVMMSPVRM
jgi:hypothetical protein